MAVSTDRTIVVTGTGNSDHFDIPAGNWVLSVHANSWGSANLQNADFGSSSWRNTKDINGEVVLTDNDDIQVVGGRSYRLNVSSWTDNITFTRTLGDSRR